ncbi:tRNA dihydrouridine synthase DusB [Cyclobacterium marinum]|uniref:tRNA-dihydrouridine synthase n=1 Tax=Cyclobacterium marinum (strain ATCC 25205 / DSM 745 / LMG 13164 / NCIMB 1802) TaxID=880070 RepID=G0J2B4_CYCMS|nr:tRNA dihydrouridine synthase DusB [Cyclobacterium marinum]AEL25188.1 TIM-barrel protein, nifR3 family [Cyclobacterium marinum DSM 745]MBI0400741.1 tRNA dihydrouridine synthase DusB [Cyclobacterium marinum]
MIKIGDLNLGDFPLLLAPMEDVSDPPFRAVCKTNGADLMYTEFISSEGLIRDAAKSVQKLDVYDYERPIGIQIFGNEISSMREAAAIAEEAGPDILDINYGCPVNKVACKGAGAGILLDIDKMVAMTAEIVKAVKIPVTVKTRLGWDESTIKINEVTERLQDVGIQAISIHARTRKQMYKGEADWSYLGEIMKNNRIKIPVFGNGDIDSPEKAKAYKEKYGVDGLMIGRAAIGYPWIFNEIKHYMQTGSLLAVPDMEERVKVAKKHLDFSVEWKGEKLGVLEMRRHYTNYFRGIPHFKPYRTSLVTTDEYAKVNDILEEVSTVFADEVF